MTDEAVLSLMCNSKVEKGWIYLTSVCGSGLLKLNQREEDLKAGFRDTHGSGAISWGHM